MTKVFVRRTKTLDIGRFFIPFLTGSKTPTSRFERNKEDKWEITARKDPISFANHQWGMKKTHTDGSLTLLKG